MSIFESLIEPVAAALFGAAGYGVRALVGRKQRNADSVALAEAQATSEGLQRRLTEATETIGALQERLTVATETVAAHARAEQELLESKVWSLDWSRKAMYRLTNVSARAVEGVTVDAGDMSTRGLPQQVSIASGASIEFMVVPHNGADRTVTVSSFDSVQGTPSTWSTILPPRLDKS